MLMYHKPLKAMARKLGQQGHHGWVTPTGAFFECDEAPAIRFRGLELGPHEKSALQWLEGNRPDLLELLEAERVAGGYECWEDTDGKDIVRNFMLKHGFVRVADDEVDMTGK